jgi:hypothetical protein
MKEFSKIGGLYVKDAQARADIEQLKKQIATGYKEIAINSFTNSVGTAEKGSEIARIVLQWTINKTPVSINLNGVEMDTSATSKTIEGPFNDDITFTLTVKDEMDNTATATTKLAFVNRIYYGAAIPPTKYNSEFILSLSNNVLRGSKLSSFKTTAEAEQYIYYCLPKNYGTCIFKDVDTGLGAAFESPQEITFRNAYGYEEVYYIYKSINANLGEMSISVS